MVTLTSLYICISYIYTYSYNFYYLSSLHSYGMSIFSVTCSMSFHISYLYFYCIPVSILCIFHIHSITYCSIFHVLLSCIVFIYCFPGILFILLSLVCTVLIHILFVYCHILSYTIVFRHVLSYTILVLPYIFIL